MALGRLSSVKTIVGVSITDTTYDSLIKNYLESSTAAFESECDTKYERDKYAEYYSINENNTIKYIHLEHIPVVSIYLVSMATGGKLAAGAYSVRDTDALFYSIGYYSGRDSVKVSYLAGYDTTGWASIGLYSYTTTTYTGYISINAISVSNKYSFGSTVAITKTSIPISIAGAKAFKWTVATTSGLTWYVPDDMSAAIEEECAIQLFKIKPSDGSLGGIGEGRAGIIKIDRGLYKGSTDKVEFEKYLDGSPARWKAAVRKYSRKMLYYA